MMDQVTPQRTRQRMPYRDDPVSNSVLILLLYLLLQENPTVPSFFGMLIRCSLPYCIHTLFFFINNNNNNNNAQSAAPSARLESFTPGGLGPAHASFSADYHEKTKNLPLVRKALNTIDEFVCRPCCVNVTVTNSKTNTTADPNLYYEDTFNDLSWSCSIGTSDEDGVWLNQGDPAGTIMAVLVWVLMGYSALTMTLLATYGGIPPSLAMLYTTLASLVLASHVKTSLTDPGAVPAAAVPTEAQRLSQKKLSMCSQCQTFKPPFSHHCRICNRCISRMDHHCPWYVCVYVCGYGCTLMV
jgi:DHHC palmitoyltransferase